LFTDNLEVILVSLDTDKEKYETFTKDMTWITSCDLKGWQGQAARDYFVYYGSGELQFYNVNICSGMSYVAGGPKRIQYEGDATCDGSLPIIVVKLTSTNNKIWMDRNLSASRAVQTSNYYFAYGCFYQLGLGNDGHASLTWTASNAGTPENSNISNTQSKTDTPGNLLIIGFFDLRNPLKDGLWQAASQVNNLTNAGFRVPTDAEFAAAFSNAIGCNSTDSATAFSGGATGSIEVAAAGISCAGDSGNYYQGENDCCWSSTAVNTASVVFRSFDSSSNSSRLNRAYGFSVRRPKD
jgi:hypothetical protein